MSITREQFESYYPDLFNSIVESVRSCGLPANAVEWVNRSLRYNVVGGKYNRGMSVVDSVRILLDRPLTADEERDAATLGWLIELLQAFFLVSDDMMDGSKTRRDQPCWYLQPDVGLIAINDSFMLEMAIYRILKSRFRSHPAYADFIDLFHETTWQTELGQLSDLLTAPEDKVDLDNFSFDKFNFIVRFKTSYYSFYLSVALDILLPMGDYFQAQDDFLDYSAPPEILGKIGTDIRDNKCSWVINTALAKASPEQRKILDENYGRKDDACEKAVRAVFDSLDIASDYAAFEESSVTAIKDKISQVDESAGLKPAVFDAFLSKIYKRKK